MCLACFLFATVWKEFLATTVKSGICIITKTSFFNVEATELVKLW